MSSFNSPRDRLTLSKTRACYNARCGYTRKIKVSLTTVEWLSRFVSLHNIGPVRVRTVMLPDVINDFASSPGEYTSKRTIKIALQYVRWLRMLKTKGLVFLHMPAFLYPTGVKDINPTTTPVEITLKKLSSFASVWQRGVVTAPTRKTTHLCDVTTIRPTRHLRFWRRQNSRWRHRSSKRNGGPLYLVFYFTTRSVHLRSRLLPKGSLHTWVYCRIRV